MVSSLNDQPSPFVKFFVASQLTGAILLSIVVVTVIFSPHITRNSAWKNQCITWIISGLSYSLLTLTGYQSGPQPPQGVCKAQAILLYGAPVLTPFALSALIIRLYFDTTAALNGVKRSAPLRNAILCIAPYLGYVVMMVGAIIYGIQGHQSAERVDLNTYCSYTSGRFGSFVAVIVIVILLMNLSILGCLIFRLYRHSRNVKSITSLRPDIHGLVRISLLQLVLVIPIVVTISFLGSLKQHRVQFDVMLAIMPLVAFLVMGMQSDIIRVWCFWGRSNPREPVSPTPQALNQESVV